MARQNPRRLNRDITTNKKGQRRARMPTWEELQAEVAGQATPIVRGATPRVQRETYTDKKGKRRVRMPSWEQIQQEATPRPTPYLDESLYPSEPEQVGFDWPTRQRARRYPELRPHHTRLWESTPELRREIIRARQTGDYTSLLPHRITNTSNPDRPRAIRAGYDPETRQLRVMFRQGDVYVYYDVEPDVWDKLITAPSFGAALDKYVIPSHEYEWEGGTYISRSKYIRPPYWKHRKIQRRSSRG